VAEEKHQEPFRYRAEVRDALGRHGVDPTGRTSPELVHEFVSDLYRYEIRRLRNRLLRNEFPRNRYAALVVELRKRYRIISMPASNWTEHS
jgi:hypothetical protein